MTIFINNSIFIILLRYNRGLETMIKNMALQQLKENQFVLTIPLRMIKALGWNRKDVLSLILDVENCKIEIYKGLRGK